MRPVPAFLISPLAGIALMPVIGFRTSADTDLLAAILGVVILVYPVLLSLQLVIAAPLRWYFARRGWRSTWLDGGLGAIAIGLPAGAYIELSRVGWTGDSAEVTKSAAAILIATLLGMSIGLTYGLLRLRDRRASARPTATDLAARFD